VKFEKWHDEEVQILIKLYPNTKISDIANKLGRSWKSVSAKASLLGLCRRKRWQNKQWSDEDLIKLKSLFPCSSKNQLVVALSNHTWGAIRYKARRLKLSQYAWQYNYLTSTYQLSDVERAYLAGIIDGEGSISLIDNRKSSQRKLTPVIAIGNTNLKMIEWLSGHLPKHYKHSKQGWKSSRLMWIIRISGMHRVRWVLEQVKPYLIAKREQADVLLEFCQLRMRGRTSYSVREREIKQKLTELNFSRKRKLADREYSSLER